MMLLDLFEMYLFWGAFNQYPKTDNFDPNTQNSGPKTHELSFSKLK